MFKQINLEIFRCLNLLNSLRFGNTSASVFRRTGCENILFWALSTATFKPWHERLNRVSFLLYLFHPKEEIEKNYRNIMVLIRCETRESHKKVVSNKKHTSMHGSEY